MYDGGLNSSGLSRGNTQGTNEWKVRRATDFLRFTWKMAVKPELVCL